MRRGDGGGGDRLADGRRRDGDRARRSRGEGLHRDQPRLRDSRSSAAGSRRPRARISATSTSRTRRSSPSSASSAATTGTSLPRRSSGAAATLTVDLVPRPPARGTVTCQALFPTYRFLAVPVGSSASSLSDAASSSTLLEPERILRLEDDRVVFLDQRKLPLEEVEVACRSAAEVADAIRTMVVRGAPAIGIAAAYGIALAAAHGEDLDAADAVLRASRPTAVNLAWALDEMRADPTRRARAGDPPRRGRALPRDGRARGGPARPGTRALTHCNAGGLATGGYGSAVGALLAAWERDLLAHVWVDETRPLLQGARLTAWELETAGIPHAVIADSAAASRMAAGEVDVVFTGADRIAAQRRHREQDRHLRARRARRPPRDPVLRRRAELDRRPRDRERRRDPDRGARPGRGHGALPSAQPRLRRDAGGARSPRSSPSTASTPRRTSESLARGGGGRVKALLLAAGYATRLRPLTDDDREAAAAGRRPPDGRLDPRPCRGGPARSTSVHVVTNSVVRAGLRALGGRRATWRSTTTARRRTRPGSARSATSASRSSTAGSAGTTCS